MFKRMKPNERPERAIPQFPHCDQRILHAPGECEYCDAHADWQELRKFWGIAFTGYEPEGMELPCPADHARGSNHAKWHGNVPQRERTADERIARTVDYICSEFGGDVSKFVEHVRAQIEQGRAAGKNS